MQHRLLYRHYGPCQQSKQNLPGPDLPPSWWSLLTCKCSRTLQRSLSAHEVAFFLQRSSAPSGSSASLASFQQKLAGALSSKSFDSGPTQPPQYLDLSPVPLLVSFLQVQPCCFGSAWPTAFCIPTCGFLASRCKMLYRSHHSHGFIGFIFAWLEDSTSIWRSHPGLWQAHTLGHSGFWAHAKKIGACGRPPPTWSDAWQLMPSSTAILRLFLCWTLDTCAFPSGWSCPLCLPQYGFLQLLLMQEC